MTLVAAWLMGTATLASAASDARPRQTAGPARATSSAKERPPAAAATPEPPEQHAAIVDILLEIRAYRTLAKLDHPAFEKLVERVASSPEAAPTRATLLAVAQTELIPITRRFLAHANDKTLILYAQNIITQIKVTAPLVGPACFSFVGADPAGAVKIAGIDRGTFDEDLLDLIADAIETSATKPQPIPKAEEIKPLLDQVMPTLEHRFGADLGILDHLDEPGIDKGKACQLAVSVYSTILYRLPQPPQTGQVLRYQFAKETGQS